MIIYGFVKGAVAIFLKTGGYRVIGKENLPKAGYVACPNHKSNWDGIIAGALIPGYVSFFTKAEAFGKSRALSWFLKKLGMIPVNRGKMDIKAMREGARILKNGGGLVVFPQGTRIKEFDIHDGKAGAAILAHNANVPVIPIGLKGKKVIVGQPMYVGEDKTAETVRIMQEIEKLI